MYPLRIPMVHNGPMVQIIVMVATLAFWWVCRLVFWRSVEYR